MTDIQLEKSTTSKILAGNVAKKRMGRILAVQAVYAHISTKMEYDLNKLILGVIDTYPQIFGEGEKFAKADEKLMITIAKGVFSKLEFIDNLISKYLADDWKFSRLGMLIQAMLRSATFELLENKEADKAVIINEYLEIAKLFNHDGEVGFINGVLDKVANSLDKRI